MCGLPVGCGPAAPESTEAIEATQTSPSPEQTPRPGELNVAGRSVTGEWGDGDLLGERGPAGRVERGRYLLVGAVSGDVALSVTRPDGRSRPVTGTSTSVLPGHTVYYDSGDWGEGWDQGQLAPLVIVTDDGRTARVRSASWSG